MRPTTQTPNRILIRTAIAATLALALTSCARQSLVSTPDNSDAPAAVVAVAPAPPSFLRTAGADTLFAPPILLDWKLVTSMLVAPGNDVAVPAGRFTLDFRESSLEKPELVTVMMYDPNILDVKFGPHGTQFKTPVRVTIDFTGTAADPGAGNTEHLRPVLWYLDETNNRWVEVPGTVNWQTKQYVVYLEHFSRYVLGSKAGWKHDTQHDSGE
jgi:hypothetical protein